MSKLNELIKLMEENLAGFTRHQIDSDSYNRGWAYCLEEYLDKARSLLAEEAAQKPTEEHPDLVTGTMPYSPTPTESIAEEPLAVLADRKGYDIEGIRNRAIGWVVAVGDDHGLGVEAFRAPTYAAAEAKARQYLASLPDKGDK